MVEMTTKNGSTCLGRSHNFGEDTEGYVAAPASDPMQLHTPDCTSASAKTGEKGCAERCLLCSCSETTQRH